MKALVMKEIKLVLHPATYILVLLGCLVVVPNWPHAVILFYACLGVFFSVMNAREAHDMDFSFPLPVSRDDMVRARMLTVVGLELLLLVVMFTCSLLRPVLGVEHLYIGMPPNLAFIGLGFGMLALFNVLFFPLYYRDVTKVGKPFLIACAAATVFGILFEAAPYLIPFVQESVAVPGFENLMPQLVVLLSGAVVFAAGTLLALTLGKRVFSRADL